MKFRLEKKRKKFKPPSRLALALAPWRFQIIVGTVLAIVIGASLLVTWYATRIPSLQITNVSVIGGSTIPPSEIEAVARDILRGAYYKLIPHTFTWLYPEAQMQAQLMQVPRVKEARTYIDGQTLTVVFEEYQPFALWCAAPDSTSCVFLDAHGYAFAEAPALTGSAFVRYINRQVEPVIKVSAFTDSFMHETGTLAERLEHELNLYVTHIVRTDEVDTSYFLADGAEIKVSERMSAADTFTNLQTLFSSKEFADIADGDFHYIDLRFGDKVFVSESEVVATSTASTFPEEN